MEWDGKPVKNTDSLRLMISQNEIGEVVKVRIIRDGNPKLLFVQLEERPPAEKEEGSSPP